MKLSFELRKKTSCLSQSGPVRQQVPMEYSHVAESKGFGHSLKLLCHLVKIQHNLTEK